MYELILVVIGIASLLLDATSLLLAIIQYRSDDNNNSGPEAN